MKRIFYICWLFAISLSSYAFQLPTDFEAIYQVDKYGSTVAEIQISLKQNNKDIIYRSHSETRGLAAVFSNEQINETSHLLLDTDSKSPRLHEYVYTRKNKPKRNQKFTLDWSNTDTATVKGLYGNKTFQLDVKDYVWDRLFVQLVLASDLQKSDEIKQKYSYSVIDKALLTQYYFEYITDEKIHIDNTNYETVKFKRTHASGNRTTYLWLSKKLNYLPVKIEQYKKGELNLKMMLSNINFSKKTQ